MKFIELQDDLIINLEHVTQIGYAEQSYDFMVYYNFDFEEAGEAYYLAEKFKTEELMMARYNEIKSLVLSMGKES